MIRARRTLVKAVLWAAGWNLRALAVVIRWATGRERIPAAGPLQMPVETVTQQLRTIDVLMARIGRER